jgi:serine/threonine protein kinase
VSIIKHEHFAGVNPDKAREYMVQLLTALQYLHDTASIVHGDIKRTYISSINHNRRYVIVHPLFYRFIF